MRGGFVLGLEDTGSRMSRLGKAELVYGHLMTVEEVIRRHIDAVTLDDVNAGPSRGVARPAERPRCHRTVRRRAEHEFVA